MREHKFEFNNLSLAYYEFSPLAKNKKDPILFFHANGYSALTYLPIYEKLTQLGFPVYALDFMGHGNSESSPDFTDWHYFKDQIIAFARHLHTESFYGVGHSLGGASLLLAASENKLKINKLGLLDPTVLNPFLTRFLNFYPNPLAKSAERRRSEFKNLKLVERSYKLMPGFRNWDEQCFQNYLKTAFRKKDNDQFELCLSPAIEAKIFRGLIHGYWPHIKKVKDKLLILTAAKSDVTPPSACKVLLKSHEDSVLIKHPVGSHFFPMEDPLWVAEHLGNFFGK